MMNPAELDTDATDPDFDLARITRTADEHTLEWIDENLTIRAQPMPEGPSLLERIADALERFAMWLRRRL
jgi:hypothetical protein